MFIFLRLKENVQTKEPEETNEKQFIFHNTNTFYIQLDCLLILLRDEETAENEKGDVSEFKESFGGNFIRKKKWE